MAEPQDLGSRPRWAVDECSSRSRLTARLLVGLAMLALGVLWTMDNLGLTDASEITRWWPVLLVVFGVAKILGWGARRSTFAGALWMVAGGWLLLHALGIVHAGFAGLWPLALILIGARYLLLPGRSGSWRRMERRSVSGIDESGRLRMDVVGANAQRRAEPGPFQGGDISAVMASAELDLRAATLGEGRGVLEAKVVMGGIVLFVPHGWHVVNGVQAVLGTIEDHTERLPEGIAPRGTLTLTGSVVMGSIEIRN